MPRSPKSLSGTAAGASRAAALPRGHRRGPAPFAVHLLDVGKEPYGDAILCRFGDVSVLIDGAHPGSYRDTPPDHPSLPAQLAALIGQETPIEVDLLVCTHAHLDHIGCLPRLVEDGLLRARWALVADEQFGWGLEVQEARSVVADAPDTVRPLAALLREEVLADASDSTVADLLTDAAALEPRYGAMLRQLEAAGTRVVRHIRNRHGALEYAFRKVGLKVLGPSELQVLLCAQHINTRTPALVQDATALIDAVAPSGRNVPAREMAQLDAERATRQDGVAAYRVWVNGGAERAPVQDSPGSGTTALTFTGEDDEPDTAELVADAARRGVGPAVNLQSIVLRFSYLGRRLLFAGDMQFADAQMPGAEIAKELEALRAVVAADGPYNLVKMAHHGSDNGIDPAFWEALGRPALAGICAGAESSRHPASATLDLLASAPGPVRWARTDVNGLSSFTFTADESPAITVAHGMLNDATPPRGRPRATVDPSGTAPTRISEPGASVAQTPGSAGPNAPTSVGAAKPAAVPTAGQAAGLGEGVASGASPGAEPTIEITARIPARAGRVTITVDVEPREVDAATASATSVSRPASSGNVAPSDGSGFTFAAGRSLDPLLVVTCSERLAAKVGADAVREVLAGARAAGHRVLELPSSVALRPRDVKNRVRDARSAAPEVTGVLVVGGYEVVRAQVLDSLPSELRDALPRRSADPDDYYVWSDDGYGDPNETGLPTLPVSRVPDGADARLLRAALGAPAPSAALLPRAGLRNYRRPFADAIYETLPGAAPMLESRHTVHDCEPPYDLAAERVYLMLHGCDQDATRFLGEDTPDNAEAMNLGNVPDCAGSTVFTGCCWGALTVTSTARAVAHGDTTWQARDARESLALAFLSRGARAFVGCTGAHYSPRGRGDAGGSPLHRAFWNAYDSGAPPAKALLMAKNAYGAYMASLDASDPGGRAINLKTLWQFTCLGLGW